MNLQEIIEQLNTAADGLVDIMVKDHFNGRPRVNRWETIGHIEKAIDQLTDMWVDEVDYVESQAAHLTLVEED